MRILVHDYCGHGFQLQLSRWLARQGHAVLHLYCPSIESPRGAVDRQAGDPPGLAIEGIALARPLAKYRPLRRALQERAYAENVAARLARFRPDVVLSGNCSPLVQRGIQAAAHRIGAGFVYWLQDLYAEAVARGLRPRLGPVAEPAAHLVRRLEHAALAGSEGVVAITEDFLPALDRAGVPPGRRRVIANWAPLTPPDPDAARAWREAQGLGDNFIFLYAGTLGLKHDPNQLAALARHFRASPEVAVVVASQGLGRDHLEAVKAREGLDNLRLLDFQPSAVLPAMTQAADVLIALLESDAGGFSVPSKVLSYLNAGRAILAAMPSGNLAARTIAEAEAGLVVPPGDTPRFLAAAERLYRRDADRRAQGAAGRAHAARTFDIDAIGTRFLAVLSQARHHGAALAPHAAMA